ncbi:Divergent Poxvirus Late Transcription Factor VLTF3 like [uncultured virus]|nr:Divergent Poxvirus Late Transcription Factor VLTF3 like [uncultured virus]
MSSPSSQLNLVVPTTTQKITQTPALSPYDPNLIPRGSSDDKSFFTVPGHPSHLSVKNSSSNLSSTIKRVEPLSSDIFLPNNKNVTLVNESKTRSPLVVTSNVISISSPKLSDETILHSSKECNKDFIDTKLPSVLLAQRNSNYKIGACSHPQQNSSNSNLNTEQSSVLLSEFQRNSNYEIPTKQVSTLELESTSVYSNSNRDLVITNTQSQVLKQGQIVSIEGSSIFLPKLGSSPVSQSTPNFQLGNIDFTGTHTRPQIPIKIDSLNLGSGTTITKPTQFKSTISHSSICPNQGPKSEHVPETKFHLSNLLFEDNMGELDIVDTRKFCSRANSSKFSENNDTPIIEDLPNKITGTYNEDYNIMYVDEIIRKRLRQEKFTHLQSLKSRYKTLETLSMQPQTYITRERTLENMKKIQTDIQQIESGERLRIYESKVQDILAQYRRYVGKVKTIIFDVEEEERYQELDDDVRHRIALIDRFLDIAMDYIHIDVIRINNRPSDICSGCGASLAKVATNEEGTVRCPNTDCQTEHNVIIMAKLAKDGSRINTSSTTDDESIDNFLRAFIRYQGLQPDRPDDSIYDELDFYFSRHDRPSGAQIRELPLNERGRRGDTNHKMLWNALSQIGRSEYYEDANYIGHVYWGWTLPNVMHLKERIIDKYNKTQKVFYQIPPEERGRNSSLGTQYRLWRHLQLEGHECYMDEFKIAENSESLRVHNKLWRLMCEGTNDPDIFYIQ